MSNAVFPYLRGLGWPVVNEPIFSTIVNEAASGMESRTALYSRPRKKWTLTFNYLAANLQASLAWSQNDMRNLKGFQMARKGKWDSFLFHDKMDSATQGTPAVNTVTNGVVGDASTHTFQLQRLYGVFLEPVYDLNPNGVNGIALSSGGSGYTWARPVFVGSGRDADGYCTISGGVVTAVVLTSSGRDYSSAPTLSIIGDGTGAAATTQLTPRVYLNSVLKATPGDYSIDSKGLITFVSAPGSGVAVTADTAFYWRARFGDDTLEFEQFLDTYFSLKKCVLYQTWV